MTPNETQPPGRLPRVVGDRRASQSHSEHSITLGPPPPRFPITWNPCRPNPSR